MSIFKSILEKTSSFKNICILFIASHLVLLSMMTLTFPVINNQIGTKAFDLQPFGYSMSAAESIINNLNDETIQLYLFPQLTLLDFFYPVLLALLLSSILFRLNKKEESKLGSILTYVPLFAMIFDYSENLFIALMISKSIEISEWVVFMSSSFTVLKGVFTSIAWVAILFYSIKRFAFGIKEKIKKQSLTKPKPL